MIATKSFKIIKYSIGLLLIFGLLSVILYVLNFSGSSISKSSSDWGQLGDYIGGVLSPIFGLINILIFIYLTLLVQDYSNKNNKKSIEMNKKVALMAMKREELNHFKAEMDKVIANWELELSNIDKAKQMLYKYNVLEYRMAYLFPKMYESEINKLFRQDLVDTLNKLEKDRNTRTGPSVVNVYGMLISELSKMVIE